MDYAALRDEIALPAYKGMSDAAIADALNAETIPVVRKVQTWEARALLLGTGEWGAIKQLSRQTPDMQSTDPAVQALVQAVSVALTTIDTMELTQVLDTDDPVAFGAMETMVGVLQAAGVLTQQTGDRMLALRDAMTSRRAQLGYSEPIRPGDVATARVT